MAQVSEASPVDPNLRPAMITTFGASGSFATSSSFTRSQAIVSMPWCSSSSRPPEENLATPITRRLSPAASHARRSIRPKVGPILPAIPSRLKSPGVRDTVSITPGVGSLRRWSSSASFAIIAASLGVAIHELPFEIRRERLGVADVIERAGEQIANDDEHVGQLARLERPARVFEKHQMGIVDRVVANRLLTRERLLGMQWLVHTAWFLFVCCFFSLFWVVRVYCLLLF